MGQPPDVVHVGEVLSVGVVDPVDGLALPVQRQILYPDPGKGGGAKRHHGAARKSTRCHQRGAGRETGGRNVAAYADQVRARRQVPCFGNDDGSGGQQDGRGTVTAVVPLFQGVVPAAQVKAAVPLMPRASITAPVPG